MEICDAVYKFGKKHKAEAGISAKEAYTYLDNLLLSGMPCDRMNEIDEKLKLNIPWF